MAGKKGRSGRRPGTTIKGKAERDQLIIDYWRQGNGVRKTAKVFRMSPAGIGKVVKGQAERKPEDADESSIARGRGSIDHAGIDGGARRD